MKLLEGNIEEFEAEENEKYAGYIERYQNEQLEEDETNPIVYEDSPYQTLNITSLTRIAFAVADDPFYKSLRGRYYPEVIVVNSSNEIVARVNSADKKSE